MEHIVENMKPSDWKQVKNIYIEGIKTGIATFQSDAPSWEEWDKSHISTCRLVARSSNNDISGWAALSPTSSRECYNGVVEVSIYVSEKFKGQGVGKSLLTKLVKESEANGFWTLYCAIIRENAASIALHKKCGFREIGIREKIAKMNDGIWHDVMLMERRSSVVGVNQ
ncbi:MULTISPECIES: GNAT family N-acetyltransferase [unclassified Sedimentibacter]|uniref:GNAT family N-acetyltransferase n=1 Tax=unclassified Sedimentibacter TaxID=2649220 RepID=UPI0027E00F89|nr:GNAT family N-acetyltransferase [Sedimentibacter sp. MB35-C1]WMJ78813.1 N-acetyltransferase family protein [Sedimentibacter sp. MB35-C1]